MYLTNCSDYLTGFCEPLSPPYRCLKKCLVQSLLQQNYSSLPLLSWKRGPRPLWQKRHCKWQAASWPDKCRMGTWLLLKRCTVQNNTGPLGCRCNTLLPVNTHDNSVTFLPSNAQTSVNTHSDAVTSLSCNAQTSVNTQGNDVASLSHNIQTSVHTQGNDVTSLSCNK